VRFEFSRWQFDGDDIRFCDAATLAPLSRRTRSWDAGAQTAEIRVRVPTSPAGGTTSILLYMLGDRQWEGSNTVEIGRRNGPGNDWTRLATAGMTVTPGQMYRWRVQSGRTGR